MPRRCRLAEDFASFEGLGLAVAELREDGSLNKADLAAKAGIASSTLREIELGRTDAKWGTLRRLAAALETPLDAVVERAEELAPGIGREARRQQRERSA